MVWRGLDGRQHSLVFVGQSFLQCRLDLLRFCEITQCSFFDARNADVLLTRLQPLSTRMNNTGYPVRNSARVLSMKLRGTLPVGERCGLVSLLSLLRVLLRRLSARPRCCCCWSLFSLSSSSCSSSSSYRSVFSSHEQRPLTPLRFEPSSSIPASTVSWKADTSHGSDDKGSSCEPDKIQLQLACKRNFIL